MDLLNKLHKELFDCVDFMAKTEDTQENTTIPKDEISKHINGFLTTAKQLETYIVIKQNQSSENLEKEIEDLKHECKSKDQLIEKYQLKIVEWEESLNRLKQLQQAALKNPDLTPSSPNAVNRLPSTSAQGTPNPLLQGISSATGTPANPDSNVNTPSQGV
eukprot:TRINITY_DN7017_c0_g1_i1.p1 TRINITY_DN7017_c0_g1~~TRINITY_DN7017_c0_g1_i1.p1  ORF type:complete len:172 (+),score=31.99 TRINITY_DN7017_c0_g1_i1:34-516(+)